MLSARTYSRTTQIVNLNENAGLQIAIVDVNS